MCWPGMYACSNHYTLSHPSWPHCWQVRPWTTRHINLLTATVQNEKEIISNNSVTALYMLYDGKWWSSYRGIKEVNKWFWVLRILLGLYCGIVLMILLVYGPSWNSNYRLVYAHLNKSTLDNSLSPLLNLKSLLRPQGQIIDVKCEKSQ